MTVGCFSCYPLENSKGNDDDRGEDAVADDADELDDEVLGVVVDVDEDGQDKEEEQNHL